MCVCLNVSFAPFVFHAPPSRRLSVRPRPPVHALPGSQHISPPAAQRVPTAVPTPSSGVRPFCSHFVCLIQILESLCVFAPVVCFIITLCFWFSLLPSVHFQILCRFKGRYQREKKKKKWKQSSFFKLSVHCFKTSSYHARQTRVSPFGLRLTAVPAGSERFVLSPENWARALLCREWAASPPVWTFNQAVDWAADCLLP